MLHEIHGNGSELLGSAALEEEDVIVIRNGHEVAEVRLSIFDDLGEGGRTMAHLHHGHAASVVIQHARLGFAKDLFRQYGGTRRKVIDTCHLLTAPLTRGFKTFAIVSFHPVL